MTDHSKLQPASSERFPTRRTLIIGAILLLAFVALESIRNLHDELQVWATAGVARFGLSLLFVLVWAADFVVQPVPPDLFVFAAGFGGADVWSTALVGGIASTVGGMTGYSAGRLLGPRRFCRLFGRALLRAGRSIFRRYGGWTIFVAAVSPVPYSGACWVAGIYGTNPVIVFITSLLSRTGRYLVMAWFGHMS